MPSRTNFEKSIIAGLKKIFPTVRVSTVTPSLEGRDHEGKAITVSVFPTSLTDRVSRQLNVALHASATTRDEADMLCARLLGVLEESALNQDLGGCRVYDTTILSGPYFNPLPDTRYRYTVNATLIVREYV